MLIGCRIIGEEAVEGAGQVEVVGALGDATAGRQAGARQMGQGPAFVSRQRPQPIGVGRAAAQPRQPTQSASDQGDAAEANSKEAATG